MSEADEVQIMRNDSDAKVDRLLMETTTRSLLKQLSTGQITSEAIVTFYLDRIESIDKSGPRLSSIIATNPAAMAEARQRDRERREGVAEGSLHGIPVLLKDNIETVGPVATTAGALALKYNVRTEDAILVKQLRANGAIILGKTNLSEWANFKSLKSSSGYSEIGGQTKNPYYLDRSPCGSSSGSAAAISANLAPLAVGTETDGSIVAPAAHCGIVGLKPTVGLVSSAGIVPISHSQDSAGPMARRVEDVAMLLNAMVNPIHPNAIEDYAAQLNTASLNGKRFGITESTERFPEVVREVFEQAVGALEAAGAEVVRGLELPEEEALGEAEFEVLLYDFKHDLTDYLSSTPDSVTVKSIDDLVEFNRANPSAISPFGQELIEMAASKGELTDEAYLVSKKLIEKHGKQEGIDHLLAEYQLDAFIAPTNTPSWLINHVEGDKFEGGSSSPAAITGYPIITVPMGDVSGLPVGLSFFSTAFREKDLIELAYCFEREINARILPEFRAVFSE
ncbi:amidase [Veronia nyctiphanis]|uniref:Amidase n=1 Tax=Veronia nyctiphanis TaxID=1278244 RepID=A0A4V1LSL6_9GAMM|nr:amidase [Veronia nyctiphanis]RXJ72128.1 amidase [Veronia nyctiphanis]